MKRQGGVWCFRAVTYGTAVCMLYRRVSCQLVERHVCVCVCGMLLVCMGVCCGQLPVPKRWCIRRRRKVKEDSFFLRRSLKISSGSSAATQQWSRGGRGGATEASSMVGSLIRTYVYYERELRLWTVKIRGCWRKKRRHEFARRRPRAAAAAPVAGTGGGDGDPSTNISSEAAVESGEIRGKD